MKILLIVNPNAGPNVFKKQLRTAQDYLLQQGCELKRVDTQAKGDATRLARQAAADGFDVAVAVGGDGTINEVCNGLANSGVAMGVLPAGTANVYAADVGIPIWSPLTPDAVTKGAEIIAHGHHRQIDLGRVRFADGSSRYFLMWCGIGLDAAISQSKDAARSPRPLNFAAWLISGLMVTYDFIGTRATITMDEGEIKERVLMAVASNGQLYGRVWRLAPEAKLDDGLLDVAVMVGHGWPSAIKHIIGMTFRKHIKDPDFHLHRTRRLTISTREALPVHVDAETIGVTPVEVEIVPGALTVILPEDAPVRLFVN
ncbi:MAG: Diacylglycerol kinase [Anaerolineae bacterium]|nr:Diacylglycerol kinase [Anaerolineae bacterium]